MKNDKKLNRVQHSPEIKSRKLKTYAQEITNIMLEQELITQEDEYNIIDYLNMTEGGIENA